jgi:ribosomal protein S18 acetylase RimI-like enzyme
MIRELASAVQLRAAYPVMRELRQDLSEAEFSRVYALAKRADRYTIVGGFDGKRCVAVMGYRILHDFVHGTHLYVDDLVTLPEERSKGWGALLLRHAEKTAREAGCQGLRLCTGVDNDAGKRFYEREGWQLRSVAYKKKL